jgi:hypothetical protein
MVGSVSLSQNHMATGPLARTKPLLRPFAHEMWLAFQFWPGCPFSWHGVGASLAR